MEFLRIALDAVQKLPVDVFWIAPERYQLEFKTPDTGQGEKEAKPAAGRKGMVGGEKETALTSRDEIQGCTVRG